MSYNIFVSHSWNYADDYEKLKNLIEDKGYFSFRNYSIPEEKAFIGTNQQVWSEIESNIKWSSAVILIAGVYVSYSDSIKQEIRLAKKHNKPVIAVEPRGSQRTTALTDDADRVVGWNADSIVNAIRELA